MKYKFILFKENNNNYRLRTNLIYVIDNKGCIYKSKRSIATYNSYNFALDAMNTLSINDYLLNFKSVFEGMIIYRKNNDMLSKSLEKEFRYTFRKLESLYFKVFEYITLKDLNDIFKNNEIKGTIIKRIKVLLSAMYRYAMLFNLVDFNLAKDINIDNNVERKNMRKKVYDKSFTDDEVERLLNDKTDILMHDIFVFILNTKLKVSEVLSLTKANVNFNSNSIVIKKNSISKSIKMNEQILEIVKRNLSNDYEFLFRNHLNKKLEYSVFRRYHFNSYMKRNNINGHSSSDIIKKNFIKEKKL